MSIECSWVSRETLWTLQGFPGVRSREKRAMSRMAGSLVEAMNLGWLWDLGALSERDREEGRGWGFGGRELGPLVPPPECRPPISGKPPTDGGHPMFE